MYVWLPALLGLLLVTSGCTKINNPTELGGDVLPAVDNIRTFQTFLETQTDNFLFTDSNKVFYSDDGSTAVEAALKLAAEHTRRCGLVRR